MKILIADDSKIVRKSLIKLIEKNSAGHIFTEAESVDDAILKAKAIKPNLIILDLAMPGGSGFDVVKSINDDRQIPTIVMLTNYATEPNRKKSLDENIDFFFDKTDEYEKVIEVLNNMKKRALF